MEKYDRNTICMIVDRLRKSSLNFRKIRSNTAYQDDEGYLIDSTSENVLSEFADSLEFDFNTVKGAD